MRKKPGNVAAREDLSADSDKVNPRPRLGRVGRINSRPRPRARWRDGSRLSLGRDGEWLSSFDARPRPEIEWSWPNLDTLFERPSCPPSQVRRFEPCPLF